METTNTKKIRVHLIKKLFLEGKAKLDDETLKDIEIEIPKYIIGVGIISVIDDYMIENKLSDYEMLNYHFI